MPKANPPFPKAPPKSIPVEKLEFSDMTYSCELLKIHSSQLSAGGQDNVKTYEIAFIPELRHHRVTLKSPALEITAFLPESDVRCWVAK